MNCPYCGSKTQVTNSRLQKRANQVWRRRQCTQCTSVFTTLEAVDTAQALAVQNGKRLEPFQRDKLLLDVYDSLRHRKTAVTDATALIDTIQKQLLPFVDQATLSIEAITEVTAVALERFDLIAATHYRAFYH